MKLIVIIITTCLMQVSAAGFAQKLTYTKKGATLEQIFTEIRKQTGYFVVYADKKIDGTSKLDVNFKNTDLQDVLDVIGKSQNLSYSFDEKNISFKPKEEPSFIENIIARFQAIDVKGKVVDSLGNGLAGATVSVKGLKQSSQTAANGDFYLKNVDEGAVLVVSYLGYVTKELFVGKDFQLITLYQSISVLDETVIKGYYNTTKRLNTGTVYSMSAKDLTKQPVSNPLIAMMGRVPNLVINPTSGLPNAALDLQLRGQNSLSSSALKSEPLIVIDGIPYQGNLNAGDLGSFGPANKRLSSLSFININDIDNISVLTDADATSIYGSRGGNGVILVTTKKGHVGPSSVNFSLMTGISSVTNKLDLLNTSEYLQIRKQAYTNDGLSIPDKTSANKNYSNYDLTVWDNGRYTDWQETFFGRSAPSYNANLSIGGGTKEMQYLLSTGYNTQKYVYPGDNKYEVGNVNLSVNHTPKNGKLKALLTGSYTFNNSQSPLSDLTGLAVLLAPNAPALYTSSGALNWEPNTETINNEGTWNNPFSLLLRTSTLKSNNLRAAADISYQVVQNLNVKLAAGYSEIHTRNLGLTPMISFDPANLSATGNVYHTNVIAKSLTMDPQLNYGLQADRNKIEGMIGASLQHQNSENETISGFGYTSDAFLKNMSQAAYNLTANNSNEFKYAGIFGRLNYNHDNKYLINLTGRRDGSSRFGPGYQFGNFWSTGLAWIFSEEQFIKNTSQALSFGKLRLSYGTSGNDAIGDYKYVELYEGIPDLTYQNIKLIGSTGASNPNYHWEKIRKLELGLEVGLFKDRILATISRWQTRCSDQIGQLPLPATGGAISITANQDATIENTGWDFLLNTRNIVSRSFSWTTSANFGIQHNKLISKPDGLFNNYQLNRFITAGQPFSGFVVVYDSKGVNPANGLYQFTDRSGNTSSDKDFGYPDAKKINTIPLTLGVANSLSYKNITIDFFVQLTKQMGSNFLYDGLITSNNPGYFSSEPGNERGNLPKEYLNHWREVGDIAAFQKLSSNSSTEPLGQLLARARESDLAWVDASYIRLRNVSVSFDFPETWKNKIKVKNVAIYLQVQNLVTITKFKGLDPEIQSATSLPFLRTVSMGMRVGF